MANCVRTTVSVAAGSTASILFTTTVPGLVTINWAMSGSGTPNFTLVNEDGVLEGCTGITTPAGEFVFPKDDNGFCGSTALPSTIPAGGHVLFVTGDGVTDLSILITSGGGPCSAGLPPTPPAASNVDTALILTVLALGGGGALVVAEAFRRGHVQQPSARSARGAQRRRR
jgi:hypothetical protein